MKLFRLLPLLLIVGCSSNDPQKIVYKAIAVAGGDKHLSSTIEFDFRDRHYIAKRNGGVFSYERIFTEPSDSNQRVHDYVTNDGFRREINQVEVAVPDSMKTKYAASVNSVLYFALLPYGLNDPSVRKKLLGETILDNKEYFKVEITFQEGGGEDYEDVFHYWISKSDFRVDFLSYSYAEDDGIGYRFRKAYNPRIVNGILFQDYINYKPAGSETPDQLEDLYKNNALVELSRIELQNISVQ